MFAKIKSIWKQSTLGKIGIGCGAILVVFSCCMLFGLVLSVVSSLPTPQPTQAAEVVFTQTPAPTPTPFPTDTPLPTPTETLLPTPTDAVLAAYPCLPAGTERTEARVVGVVDGDTIDVSIGGQTYRVRYIGMDTPEQNEPYYAEATAANSRLVEGKKALLIKDVSETDRYGRLLRYVLVDGVFVNLRLVEDGYALPATYPPDVACADTFAAAAQRARELGVGLWQPTPTAKPTAKPVQRSGNCDPAYPDVCIPSPPPDLGCKDIPYKRFRVLPPDPHRFDKDGDGIGCES